MQTRLIAFGIGRRQAARSLDEQEAIALDAKAMRRETDEEQPGTRRCPPVRPYGAISSTVGKQVRYRGASRVSNR